MTIKKNKKPHKNLILWQKSIEFVLHVYKLSEKFPAEEMFGITSQIRRAAISISLNIAEGAGRNHQKEFIQFLGISNGSISELDTLNDILLGLKFISETEFQLMDDRLSELSALNNGLLKKLKSDSSH